jgi:hypothetical protein
MGAHQRSNHTLRDVTVVPTGCVSKVKHILLGGALAPRRGVSKVKPYAP